MANAKIIFVDDDSEVRDLIKQCLFMNEIGEYQILDSGYSLFSYLGNKNDSELPELIVLDLNMPFQNGYKILRAIKSIERYQKIPVFLLTISDKIPIVVQSIKEGAAGYYRKPNNIEEYNQIIRELYQIAME